MPKTVFLAINSKFVHTLLSVRYLDKYVDDSVIYETNINVNRQRVLTDLYKLSPQNIAISCYIFNIEYVKLLVLDLRVLMPSVKIILGGYNAESVADFENRRIIYGEGEHCISAAINGKDREYYADTIANLDDVISPYDEQYISLGKNKILYFESSRGCPFSCSYCMSANQKVRYFSMPRVMSDLDKIVSGNVMQVKFVDRTFNANIDRACQIFEHILNNYSDGGTNFHFEMAPELFNDKLFAILQRAKKGLIQLEIGVQSFNQHALNACNRKINAEVVKQNISRLKQFDNMHIHTDLIAGLPLEDYGSFVKSFDELYGLNSDMLQLGFLKLLPGSDLQKNAQKYGYLSFSAPPYEIVKSNWLSYDDICNLKIAEATLDRYYNSGKYITTLKNILPLFDSPYEFYFLFGKYLTANSAFDGSILSLTSFNQLYDFALHYAPADKLTDWLNTDYALCGNVRKFKRR